MALYLVYRSYPERGKVTHNPKPKASSTAIAAPQRERRGSMSDHDVAANQKTILHRQATILDNQRSILAGRK
jgi:hypothetical protein